ncbi:MAG TPA: hypothetical protein PLN52_05940, partial [Opitutaceae bacterium]|nr:hypothetical protein [Opitutaceae bacterium]
NSGDSSAAPSLVNLSSRGRVGRDGSVMIVGFVIGGDAPRAVLIRGVGPALKRFGVMDTLENPHLALHRGATRVEENANWALGNDRAAIRRISASVGAFALDEDSDDAVTLIVLEPGSYTALLSGENGSEGVGLIEIYDVPVLTTPRLPASPDTASRRPEELK